MLSVKEASKLAGVSKSAIFQRIKSGKLSAKRDHSNAWIIDPAELERSFGGLTSKIEENVHTSFQQNFSQNKDSDAVLIEQLNNQLNSTQEQLRQWQRMYQDSEKERKETQEKLTLLLIDQSSKPKKKGLLGRLFG